MGNKFKTMRCSSVGLERLPHKEEVEGSSPSTATILNVISMLSNRSYVIIEEDEEGGRFYYNRGHEFEVWKARKARGMNISRRESLLDHPLIGINFKNKRTEKFYKIEKVYKYWHMGWYISILFVDSKGSHGTAEIENINCFCDIILEHIKRNKDEFEFLYEEYQSN
jgi:hypothetical protein